MTQPAPFVTAAVVGAIAGAVAGALIALSPLGRGGGGPHQLVIVLNQEGSTCSARTAPPERKVVFRREVIEWRVAGNCQGINRDEVEVQFVGTCGTTGKTVITPDVFDEDAPHKGRRIVRTVKGTATEACYRYQIVHGSTVLQDPELEIWQ
jgi:hypothetical protein